VSRNVRCDCCDAMVREDGLSPRRWCIKCELEFEALQEQKRAKEKILQFSLPFSPKKV
jgi:hypothetical protein